jgi:BsuBI/PstI restriction endonuclease domain/BsuBI/PstI restriction endonuclease HTH domain
MDRNKRIKEGIAVLGRLGMPRAQQNERSALCLLALLNLTSNRRWSQAEAPLMGITPIMDWARDNYGKSYAPNTRETVRRQTMHQFVQAGIALYNPDDPNRPTNSPHAVYQIEPTCLAVLRTHGTTEFELKLRGFAAARPGLAAKYAKHREMKMVPLTVAPGQEVALSPGAHSELIKQISEEFGPRFVPGGKLVYAGDTGEKWGYFDEPVLGELGIKIDNHGKMPDVIIYFPDKDWLILAEAVTSHGPVDAKRHRELEALFGASRAGLVFVSAFPDRKTFTRYAEAISWETEVWIADNPSHLIHYNGARFLGPYARQ